MYGPSIFRPIFPSSSDTISKPLNHSNELAVALRVCLESGVEVLEVLARPDEHIHRTRRTTAILTFRTVLYCR